MGSIIPDKLTYPGIVLGLLYQLLDIRIPASPLWNIGLGGLMLIKAVVSNGGMGGGDIKKAGCIGLYRTYRFGGYPDHGSVLRSQIWL
jgi:leader peptidase (prepilin peptidase)/N-methyltransferase